MKYIPMLSAILLSSCNYSVCHMANEGESDLGSPDTKVHYKADVDSALKCTEFATLYGILLMKNGYDSTSHKPEFLYFEQIGKYMYVALKYNHLNQQRFDTIYIDRSTNTTVDKDFILKTSNLYPSKKD